MVISITSHNKSFLNLGKQALSDPDKFIEMFAQSNNDYIEQEKTRRTHDLSVDISETDFLRSVDHTVQTLFGNITFLFKYQLISAAQYLGLCSKCDRLHKDISFYREKTRHSAPKELFEMMRQVYSILDLIDSCAKWDPDQGLLLYNVDCMRSNNKNKRDKHKNGTGLKYEWERKYYDKVNNRNAIIERARAQILYKISCLLQHIDQPARSRYKGQ